MNQSIYVDVDGDSTNTINNIGIIIICYCAYYFWTKFSTKILTFYKYIYEKYYNVSHICIYDEFKKGHIMYYMTLHPDYVINNNIGYMSGFNKNDSIYSYMRKIFLIDVSFKKNQYIKFYDKHLDIHGHIETYTISKEITREKFYKPTQEEFNKCRTMDEYDKLTKQKVKKLARRTYMVLYLYNTKTTPIEFLKLITKSDNNKNCVLNYSKTLDDYGSYKYLHTIEAYNGTKIISKKDRQNIFKSFIHPKKEHLMSILERIHFNKESYTKRGEIPRFNAILYGYNTTMFIEKISKAYRRNIINIDLTRVYDKKYVYSLFQTPDYREYKGYKISNCIMLLENLDETIKYFKIQNKIKMDNLNNNSKPKPNDIYEYLTRAKNKNEQIFQISNLLEILQIPISGQMIIATATNIDTIKNAYPALLDKLKPIKF